MVIRSTRTAPETVVPNDGKALPELLKLDAGSFEHVGNFVFKATKDGAEVTIYTEPHDEEQETLLVKEVIIQG